MFIHEYENRSRTSQSNATHLAGRQSVCGLSGFELSHFYPNITLITENKLYV